MSDPIPPGFDAPSSVTVYGPGAPPSWFAHGRVTGRAPYSIHVQWEGPQGETRSWFVWDPDKPNHGRQHGVGTEFAIRVEAAG